MKNIVTLRQYAEGGSFVFHGSPQRIDKLVPMQAKTLDAQTGIMINDGKPAVVATQFLDIAIFRALVNKSHCPINYRSSFGLEGGRLFFKATGETLASATQPEVRGFVHVLDSKSFRSYSPKEVRAYDEVTPVDIVEVSPNDLPKGIQIIS